MVWVHFQSSSWRSQPVDGTLFDVPEVLYMFPHLVLQPTRHNWHFCLRFADKQSKARRGEAIRPIMYNWNVNARAGICDDGERLNPSCSGAHTTL